MPNEVKIVGRNTDNSVNCRCVSVFNAMLLGLPHTCTMAIPIQRSKTETQTELIFEKILLRKFTSTNSPIPQSIITVREGTLQNVPIVSARQEK